MLSVPGIYLAYLDFYIPILANLFKDIHKCWLPCSDVPFSGKFFLLQVFSELVTTDRQLFLSEVAIPHLVRPPAGRAGIAGKCSEVPGPPPSTNKACLAGWTPACFRQSASRVSRFDFDVKDSGQSWLAYSGDTHPEGKHPLPVLMIFFLSRRILIAEIRINQKGKKD